MRRNSHARLVSLTLVLFLTLLVRPAGAGPKSLPDAIIHAHTVFVENETGFNELQYALVLELSKWGRFELSDSREKADLSCASTMGITFAPCPTASFRAAR